MKIAFLHLSDLHLQDRHGVHPAKITAVVTSLAVHMPFQGIVIILSGDITASGDANQYKIAATLLGRLITALKSQYSISEKNTKLLIVPGNHDITRGCLPEVNPKSISLFNEVEKEEHLQRELQRMKNYFSFSDKNGCFFNYWRHVENGQLITRKILTFDNGYSIEANLINTAPFSGGSDMGIHYLPDDAIHSLTTGSGADLSIAVMHHSPDWFEYSQKIALERVIAERCSLAFYGHEHLPGTQHILYDNGSRILNQAGGAWWHRATPMRSEYYTGLFDSENRKYCPHKFSWDNDRSTFVRSGILDYTLMVKSLSTTGLIYREDYTATLMEDPKNTIAPDVSDYFVFPGLRLNASKEYSKGKPIDKMEDILSFIKENKYVAIIGGSNSGKTTLLKMLFKELHSKHVVLYCGTDDITGRSQENILKELVQNTFGENTYSSFQCIPTDKKTIIIDDLHRISSKHLDKFIRGLEDIFGTIIIATEETAQFDAVQMVKDNIKANTEFKKVNISRLYAEKRLALIKKIVLIKSNNDVPRSIEIARTLEQCLNSYKLAFRTEIDFVVQFVNYYCAHMGELDKSDATVFSKVFEASIERAIAPSLIGRRENPNDIIVALSEIAHYIHFNKEYSISAIHINDVITEYCQYYDNRYLTSARFIEITETSGLLLRAPSGYEFRFASKNHLAYFIAKALNRKFHDTGSTSDLETIVRQSCFSINGDILLFLTYISDNVNIPRLLLEQAVSYVSAWTEFDLSNIGVQYLRAMPTNLLTQPADNEKEQEVRTQTIDEEEYDAPIETVDIYDYDETEIDKLTNQLIRASLQLKIIARNFSAFISILPATAKKDYVLAMYQLPNKIFNQWAEYVDNNLERFVEEIVNWQETTEVKGKKMSRENIIRFFQETSQALLISLYYNISIHGANDNTVDYLSQQDFISTSLNYQIERLIFFEKVDDYNAVIREAEALYGQHTDGMAQNLILAILRRMLVYSDKITDRERRRISSKYFAPQTQTIILMDRQKAQKENGI